MLVGFQIKDIIDILLVAFLMYQTFLLVKGTNALNVFLGIIAFIFCWFLVSFVFKLNLLGAIFDKIMSVGAIALVVIFQQEIRRFFSMIGNKRRWKVVRWLSKKAETEKDLEDFLVMQLVLACTHMSKNKCGAIIIVGKTADLSGFYSSGEIIKSSINARLIESIFFKNNPLHDGAMIIANKKIMAVGCILPVSKNKFIPKNLGLRHRSALGITEKTDAIAIVISEESGKISIAKSGDLFLDVSSEQLERFLSNDYSLEREIVL